MLGGLPAASIELARRDVDAERGFAKFDPSSLTSWIYGSTAQVKLLRDAAQLLSEHKVLGPLAGWQSKRFDMSRD